MGRYVYNASDRFLRRIIMNKKLRVNKRLDNFLLRVFVVVFVVSVMIYILRVLWFIFVPIIAIFLILFIILWIRRHKRLQSYGTNYTVRKHCPNCGRMNDFHYPMGSPATGIKRDCSKCGTSYSEGEVYGHIRKTKVSLSHM